MKQSIRRVLNANFLNACILCSVVAAGGVWIAGELLFRSLYRDALEVSLINAANRLQMFDDLVYRAELRSRERGKRALLELGRRFRNLEDAAALSGEELRTLADALEVSEVYFVDGGGTIAATSFAPDRGHNLFAAGGDLYVSRLKALYGQGVMAEQRLAQSMNTGIVNTYQYYSPPGSDMLIECSTSLRASVADFLPGTDYDGFVATFLMGNASRETAAKSLVRITDFLGVTGGSCWSLYEEGARRDHLLASVREAAQGRASAIKRGSLETRIIPMADNLDDSFIIRTRRYGVVTLDKTPLFRFRLLAAVTFLCAIGLSVAVSLLSFRRRVLNLIASRTERLVQSIEDASTGDFVFRFEESEEDELTAIADRIAVLSRSVREKTKELSSALDEKDSLLHEVHHRVKNNMQLVLSLLNLKLSAPVGKDVAETLSVFRNHIYSISLVEERIHSRDAHSRIVIGDFCRELAYSACMAFPDRSAEIHVRCADDLPAIPPDRAIPLGIIISESVTNSLKHGVHPGREGRILISCGYRDGRVLLSISDDGPGSSSAVNADGIGLVLLRALASQLSADLSAGDGTGDGWTVNLSFVA